MAESTTPKDDRLGADAKQGPNPAPGGAVDVENAPPYDGRTTGGNRNEDRAESVSRQLDGAKSATGETASPAQESPATDAERTDAGPESPKGVGGSENTSGEEIKDRDGKERGRHDGPTDPKTGRSSGTSDERDVTGI